MHTLFSHSNAHTYILKCLAEKWYLHEYEGKHYVTSISTKE